MTHNAFKDRIEPAEIADDAQRKSVFRAMAQDFLSAHEKRSLNGPDEIASMMEQAFKAGVGSKKVTARRTRPAKPLHPPFSIEDLPYDCFYGVRQMRHHLFNTDSLGKWSSRAYPRSERLFIFKSPKDANDPTSVDEWRVFSRQEPQTNNISNEAFLPMIKAGLFEYAEGVLDDGWEVAFVTERGFEFFLTGKTAMPADYTPGFSSTIEEYRRIAPHTHRLSEQVEVAGLAYDLWDPEPESAPRL